MLTQIQIEARKRLEYQKRTMEVCETFSRIGGMVATAIGIPAGGLIMWALFSGLKKLDDWSGPSPYVIELEKATRGERDTLPEPPPDLQIACS